jgi:hypothetical protein
VPTQAALPARDGAQHVVQVAFLKIATGCKHDLHLSLPTDEHVWKKSPQSGRKGQYLLLSLIELSTDKSKSKRVNQKILQC